MKKLLLIFISLVTIVSCSEESYDDNSKLGLMSGDAYDMIPAITEEMPVMEDDESYNSYEWAAEEGDMANGTYTVHVADGTGLASTDANAANTKSSNKNGSNIAKKIIKKARIGYEVDDYAVEIRRIKNLVNTYGGYISSEGEESSNYRIENSLVIRLPAEVMDKLMDTLTSGVKRLDYKTVTAQDVTEEFVDIQARLKTKREVEERFVEILGKAKTIEEILEVENQLRKIREEIEAKEGRLKYLENQVGLSTIDLHVYQTLDYKYVPQKGKGFGERLLQAMDKGWKGLLNLIIGIVYLWPFLLILGAIAFFLRRYFKRKRQE